MKDRNHCTIPALDSVTGYPAPLSGYLTVMWHPGAQRVLPVLVQSPFQRATAGSPSRAQVEAAAR